MLQTIIIGHLGADAEYKNENGREFVVFRIANTDRWTDDAGQKHESTTWVDCIMNGKPKVFDWLKKGQQVYACGPVNLRVYSSAKDKCMKAGMTINVKQIELLGGRADDVPSRLYSEDGTQEVVINKHYHAPQMVRDLSLPEALILVSKAGEKFTADRSGFVTRLTSEAK